MEIEYESRLLLRLLGRAGKQDSTAFEQKLRRYFIKGRPNAPVTCESLTPGVYETLKILQPSDAYVCETFNEVSGLMSDGESWKYSNTQRAALKAIQSCLVGYAEHYAENIMLPEVE